MRVLQLFVLLLVILNRYHVLAQTTFNYSIQVEPFHIDGLPGLHSFSIAQQDGKWLIIGGRIDGLHPRMPMNSFSSFKNNTNIYVVEPAKGKVWHHSVNDLPVSIREQLQSSNPNYFQDKDTLYFIGGYAFSRTANGHITFPYLTGIHVSKLINAIVENKDINDCFKQISDSAFAVTGGQLAKIKERFYLVGGHRFDGTYNPEGQPSFTQHYTNQVRSFRINNNAEHLSISDYRVITDAANLHRRDYNLIPQIFSDGSEGYCISSGVFQYDVNKPFLYPVDIRSDGITAYPNFNQYLSNYHTAHIALYEQAKQEMHTLFFGGMGVGNIENNTYAQDSLVPFVNTISRLSRAKNNIFEEYALNVQLPQFHGVSSAFLNNESLPHTSNDILLLDEIKQDTIFLGYIVGGILSKTQNPFVQNETAHLTSASATHYKVNLIRTSLVQETKISGENPFINQTIFTETDKEYLLEFNLLKPGSVRYLLLDTTGNIMQSGKQFYKSAGMRKLKVSKTENIQNKAYKVQLIFEDTYFVEMKIKS